MKKVNVGALALLLIVAGGSMLKWSVESPIKEKWVFFEDAPPQARR
jgi:hypothetical protein